MEPEVKQFLQKIVRTLTAAFLWLLFNVIFGLKLGWAFWEGSASWKNVLFYICFIGSIILLLKLYHKWWKEHL